MMTLSERYDEEQRLMDSISDDYGKFYVELARALIAASRRPRPEDLDRWADDGGRA